MIRKRKIVSTGIRTSDPLVQSEVSTAELFNLLMNGLKISVYEVPIFLFTLHSLVCTCDKMANCEQF